MTVTTSDKNKMPDSVAELLAEEFTQEMEASAHLGATSAVAVAEFWKGVKDTGMSAGGAMALTHAFAAWLFRPDLEEIVEEES